HGRSGVQRWLMGSIAHRVLHAAINPLLLIRPKGTARAAAHVTFKTCFVPLDGSPVGEQTLPHVEALSKALNIEVVIIRAYESMAQGHVPFADSVKARMREEAEAYLKDKVRQLEERGIKRASYLLPLGNAAEKIVDITRAAPESLVVICTHGRSGIGRWVLGSVTDHVVRDSGNPVLVVRAPR
ncbi:MAG TPA: universal stress protein, partial [Candidatus Binatia bacterium]